MLRLRWQQVLERCAGEPAVTWGERVWSFSQLQAEAERWRGQVACGTTLEVLLAVLSAMLHERWIQVVEKDRAPRVPAMTVPVDCFLIKQTVGASGYRRCQFFTAAQLLADVDRIHAALGLSQCCSVVGAISAAHSYGLTTTVLQTLFHGLPLRIVEQPFPQLLQAALHEAQACFLPGIPALWRSWAQARVEVNHVRLAVSAGSPLSLGLEHLWWQQAGLKLHNLYGTSETGAISYDDSALPRQQAGDVGQLLPGVQVQQTHEKRLCVQSSAVGLGYDELRPGESFQEGAFLTSDLGTLENQQLLLYGSVGAGINVAGRKLAPEEIATKLRQATGMNEIWVGAESCRDVERCQQVVAYVLLPAECLTPAFRQKACSTLASWEMPRRWVSVREAPPLRA